jgi:hypothetical protein
VKTDLALLPRRRVIKPNIGKRRSPGKLIKQNLVKFGSSRHQAQFTLSLLAAKVHVHITEAVTSPADRTHVFSLTSQHLNGVTIILHKFHTEKEKIKFQATQKRPFARKYTERKFGLSISKELASHFALYTLRSYQFL